MRTTVDIRLTRAQAEALLDILRFYDDRGPLGEGWQSPDLQRLVGAVDEALKALGADAAPPARPPATRAPALP